MINFVNSSAMEKVWNVLILNTLSGYDLFIVRGCWWNKTGNKNVNFHGFKHNTVFHSRKYKHT